MLHQLDQDLQNVQQQQQQSHHQMYNNNTMLPSIQHEQDQDQDQQVHKKPHIGPNHNMNLVSSNNNDPQELMNLHMGSSSSMQNTLQQQHQQHHPNQQLAQGLHHQQQQQQHQQQQQLHQQHHHHHQQHHQQQVHHQARIHQQQQQNGHHVDVGGGGGMVLMGPYIHDSAVQANSHMAMPGQKRRYSTSCLSMKTVARWRLTGDVNLEHLFGCSDTCSFDEKNKAEDLLRESGQLVCVLCNSAISANKKAVRRHQVKNRNHLNLLSQLVSGAHVIDRNLVMTTANSPRLRPMVSKTTSEKNLPMSIPSSTLLLLLYNSILLHIYIFTSFVIFHSFISSSSSASLSIYG